MSHKVAYYLQLHRRVKAYGVLPEPGGLLDQPSRVMRILDVIGEEVRAYEQRQDQSRSTGGSTLVNPPVSILQRGRF